MTFFINLHYSNITMVLIIRKCMFNRPALLINNGGCKIFFKACYKLFLPACLSVLSRNKMPQDILSSLQIHTYLKWYKRSIVGQGLQKKETKNRQRLRPFFLQLIILPSKNQALIFIMYFTSSFISLVLLLNNFCLSKVRSTLKNGQTVFF